MGGVDSGAFEMSLKGNVRTLKALAKSLRNLPITASARIAARAAPEVTALVSSAYDAGRTVYGNPRPRSEPDGDRLTLVRSGDTRNALSFTATGTQMRLTRLPAYAKYLIGPRRPGHHYSTGAGYGILPNGPLPQDYRDLLEAIAVQVLHDQIFKPGAP